jgi:fatty acid desaturase
LVFTTFTIAIYFFIIYAAVFKFWLPLTILIAIGNSVKIVRHQLPPLSWERGIRGGEAKPNFSDCTRDLF